MATDYFDGVKMREIELLDVFPPSEGMITQYYGRIGSGKTYSATADVIDLLNQGEVVYANWKIQYKGFDERKSFIFVLASIILPWRKKFFHFPRENLHYFEFSDKWAKDQGHESFIDWFSSITDAHLFGDEGHVMFDSYQGIKMPIEKRAAILHTRHFNRSIHIISQRPTAIHVSMRANVNVFYRCQTIWRWGNFIRFRRTEFQDMEAGDTVNESDDKIISRKHYWGRQEIFEAYDTKYLRGDVKNSQELKYTAYTVPFLSRLVLLGKIMLPSVTDGIIGCGQKLTAKAKLSDTLPKI